MGPLEWFRRFNKVLEGASWSGRPAGGSLREGTKLKGRKTFNESEEKRWSKERD